MKIPLLVAAVLIAVLGGLILLLRHNAAEGPSTAARQAAVRAACSQSDAAFARRQSDVWLTLSGTVSRLLPDQHGHFLHQRFILRCADAHTVLVVNDVDIGRRVPVHPGDAVAVRGQYVWNAQGGLVHFTHHDPQGGQGGWIVDGGKTYSLAPLLLPMQAI